MSNTDFQSPEEVLATLGQRLRALRDNRGLTQQEVADRAGISARSLRTLENGDGSNLATLVRVLKALDATQGLDALVPEPSVSPMQLLRQRRG